MKRIVPRCRKGDVGSIPCSRLALACALIKNGKNVKIASYLNVYSDGYCPLKSMDKLVKRTFAGVEYRYFPQDERPKLDDLKWEGKYIVCLLEHFIYVEGNKYYSLFDNTNDEVVAVWKL